MKSNTQQPASSGITRSLRTFQASDEDESQVTFTEFRGVDLPSIDLGVKGDTYIRKLTPTDEYELYARFPQGWEKWPGTKTRKTALVHPEYPERFLWCSLTQNCIGWYKREKMKRIHREYSIPHKDILPCLNSILT